MLPIALVFVVGGAVLLRSAVRGENPVRVVMDALTGTSSEPAFRLGVAGRSLTAPTSTVPATDAPPAAGATPATTTTTTTGATPAGSGGATAPPSRSLTGPTSTVPGPPATATPAPAATSPNSAGAATQRMQAGLPERTQRLWQAVAQLPGVSMLGAWGKRGYRSYHASGEALDASVIDKASGDRVAAWALQNAQQYGITEIIWYRKIATSGRGWTWRDYTGPGGPHTDHVHMSCPS